MKSRAMDTRAEQKQPIRRILILGHSGFIGSHLYKKFAETFPRIELIGRSFPELDLSRSESVEVLKGLFSRQSAVVLCSGIKRQLGDSLDIFEKNMAIVSNVARALEISPVGRLIFFSSMAVYGEDIHNPAISESTQICPRSYYGLAKYAGEKIFERIFSRQEGAFLAIRPPVIYGFGDASATYGPAGFLKASLEGEAVTLWGDAEELREFIYIDDIVDIVSRLVTGRQTGVLNIASGRSYSFREVLDAVKKIFPEGVQVKSRPRTKDKADIVVQNLKLKEWLGDFRFTPIEEGIRKMFMLEQGRLKSEVKA